MLSEIQRLVLSTKISGEINITLCCVCQPTRYISFSAATLTDLNANRHLSSTGPKMIPLVAFSLGSQGSKNRNVFDPNTVFDLEAQRALIRNTLATCHMAIRPRFQTIGALFRFNINKFNNAEASKLAIRVSPSPLPSYRSVSYVH